jgi:hypothetical protein
MSGPGNDPARQFAAAWEAASGAVGEWAQRVADATNDALDKLDPAVRAALEAGRMALEAGRDAVAPGHPNAVALVDPKPAPRVAALARSLRLACHGTRRAGQPCGWPAARPLPAIGAWPRIERV